MAFKSIGTKGTQSERKPFVEEYLETLDRKELKKQNNSIHNVSMLSFGRKGVILTTELFSIFVWKSSELYNFLQEAADVWAMGSPANALCVFITDAQNGEYELGVNDEEKVTWDSHKRGKKLTVSTDETAIESEPLENPFL